MNKSIFGIVFLVSVGTVLVAGGSRETEPAPVSEESSAPAPSVPSEPIIAFNAEGHVGSIADLASDGRLVLTVDRGKQAKLWRADDGSLLRTLRIPIGQGYEGELLAGALSPDGALAAVAGKTGLSWNGRSMIYIFNTRDGSLAHTVYDLPLPVNSLAFSPDGFRLVVGFRELRFRDEVTKLALVDTGSWRVIRDIAIDEVDWPITDIAVSKRGEIAASSPGKRYLINAELTRSRETERQMDIFSSAEFSSGGDYIVFGADIPNGEYEVLDTRLRPVGSLSVGNDERFSVLHWSTDGTSIIGIGARGGRTVMRRWDASSFEQIFNQVLPIGGYLAESVLLKDDSLLYTNGNEWGKINADGSFAYRIRNRQHLFRGESSLIVYPSRMAVSVLGTGGIFSLRERGFIAEEPGRGFRTQLQGNKIELSYAQPPGHDLEEILLNGRRIFPSHHTWGMRQHVFGDDESFLIFNSRKLVHCDQRGRELWSFAPMGGIVSITGSREHGYFTIAFDDGTIRWYRLADGKKLLTLYLSPEDSRWIISTPQGYYDCSPGAQKLIGWQVNRGSDTAADFFPFDAFPQYYRPDVISDVLTTLDVGVAVSRANERLGGAPAASITELLPPVVEIESAEFSEPKVVLKLGIRSPSGKPVDSVKLLFNRRPLLLEEDLNLSSSDSVRFEIEATLPGGPGVVSVLAAHGDNWSAPVELDIQAAAIAAALPKLHIFAAGASDYADNELDLSSDGTELVAADLSDWAEGRVSGIEATVLSGAEATRQSLIDALAVLENATETGDIAVIFLSGHGVSDIKGRAYFLPVDAGLDEITRTALPLRSIAGAVGRTRARVLVVLDVGRDGPWREGREGLFRMDYNGIINQLIKPEVGACVLSASSGARLRADDNRFSAAFSRWLDTVSDFDALLNPGAISIIEEELAEAVFIRPSQ